MGERHVWPDDPAAGEGEAGTFGGELSMKEMAPAEVDHHNLTHDSTINPFWTVVSRQHSAVRIQINRQQPIWFI